MPACMQTCMYDGGWIIESRLIRGSAHTQWNIIVAMGLMMIDGFGARPGDHSLHQVGWRVLVLQALS